MKTKILIESFSIILMLILLSILSAMSANAEKYDLKKVEINELSSSEDDLIIIPISILVDDKTYEVGNFGATKAFVRSLGDYSWKVGNKTYVFKPEYFKMKELLRGKLTTENYDVLIYPPNTADEFLLKTGFKNLPKNKIWKRKINEFIKEGGGYFGACGGALIAGGMSNNPNTFLERAMKNSQLGISEVNFELNMAVPILNQIRGKDPSSVDTQAYLFYSGWGGSNTPHLSFSGASLDCPILKDNPIFDDYIESTRRLRWIGSPGFDIPENPDREINLLVKFPDEEISDNESLRIYHWKYVGGILGLIKGQLFGKGEVIWCENIPLMRAFLFSTDWVKTDKIVKTNLKNKGFMTSEIYPNENKARIVRCTGHPELLSWQGGHIVEAEDNNDNNIYKGFYYWENIIPFEKTVEDERSYNDWIIRRSIAWASKEVPDNHLPPVYGPSQVSDIYPYNQTSSEFKILGNSELAGEIVTLDLFYRHSDNNETWGNWTLYSTDSDVSNGWSWEFSAPNGTGYYQFYSLRHVRFEYEWLNETVPPGPDAIVYVKG
ncbi:MAG: hypothetical protein KAW45_02655 [Thermoplasmatales archaeon]|nr:hypothetical protein [Thermoplasmatales archaeon]